MRYLVLGNGIDIQYGGLDLIGNEAILKRVYENINSDKYKILGWDKEILLNCFNGAYRTICDFLEGNSVIDPSYLFLHMDLERLKKSYTSIPTRYTLGLEDYFLAIEIMNEKKLVDEKSLELTKKAFQAIFLDAIYFDGKINEIYKSFPTGLISFLKRYDAIFTLNYDTNLESAISDVPIYHLHGCFSHDGNLISDLPKELRHMSCNGIMTWYWLEKYGEEEKDFRYGRKVFDNIEGSVDLIGISPCNDGQLFLELAMNSKLRNCTYYYFNRSEASLVKNQLGNLKKHTTEKDVKNLWRNFR